MGATSAWGASTTYVGTMYTYDVVFGTPNAETPTGINGQTDFTTDYAEKEMSTVSLVLTGTVLSGNQANGRTYAFSTAPTTGSVTFKSTFGVDEATYSCDYFTIRGTVNDGTEDQTSYAIVKSPTNLGRDTGTSTVLRIFGTDITASVYTPRSVLYGIEVTIDITNQKVDYTVTYASKGSSGTPSALSTVSGSVSVPDGYEIKSVADLYMPRNGESRGCYYDNVAFYSAVSNETLYSATFVENNGLNPAIKIYSDSERSLEVSNGELADKTTYYYRATLHGYENYEGSFTVDGANPSVNFTMTALEAVTSLDVYARINSANHLIKSIELTDKYVGDQVTFTYPKYYKIGTTLYQISDNHKNTHGGYYKWSNYALDGSPVVLDYDAGTIENVIYFSEGEDIDGMTADASSNADIRCSGGQGGRSADELSLTTLETGVYKLCSQVWGSKNEGATYTFRAADKDVLVHALTGALDDKDVSFSVVSGTAAIKIQGVNTNGRVLDYVYIQRIDNATVSVYNSDFDNSTWDAGWLGTGTNKATAFAKQTSSQTWGATGNFAEMWTNGSYSAEANLRQILINVPAGNYTRSADILNNVASSGGVLYAKVGNASDVTTVAENGSGANGSVSFTVTETSNVEVGFKTTDLTSKKGWIAVDNFNVSLTATPATLGTNGYATFASPYPLDLTTANLPAGLTAYKAAVDGTTVTFTQLNQTVPANTGILLQGDASENYNIPVVSSGTAVTENAFLVNDGGTTFTGDANYYYFGLIKNSLTFGVFDPSSVAIPASKAYLKVQKNSIDESPSRALTVRFGDEATGINAVKSEEVKDNSLFNLSGQRVSQPTKGLYIVNGKKVIIK